MLESTAQQASGQLTLDEVIRFYYFSLLTRMWPLLSIILAVGVTGLVLSFLRDEPPADNERLSYLFPVAFACVLFLLTNRNARKQYASAQALREPVQYEYSAEGVKASGPHFSTEAQWAVVRQVRETKSAFLIYYSEHVAWILPKRFFGDEQSAGTFRGLAQKHLGSPKQFSKAAVFGQIL